ncbi:MAG: glycosyltransferase [Anaerolineae bacterium]|nr:glycosyltransferase [Anaerolineae bacterium]MDW8171711.1 glycosyltransferase [Anaerolineae bacterium]
MHVLVLASSYPSSIRPHTGIFFQEQAEALHRAGHQLGVIVLPRIRETLDAWRTERAQPPAFTREDRAFPVYRMHRGWFPRAFPYVCAWLTRRCGLPAYGAYCEAYGRPDVIHAHNIFYAGYLASVIRQLHGVPAVLTEHSSNHLNGRMFLPAQRSLIRRTLGGLDVALAVGGRLRQALSLYGHPIGPISNLVNTAFFHDAPMPPMNPFIFAAVGSLVAVKNFPLLLRAFHQAFAGQNVLLRIGGDGPQRRALERLIAELGLSRQVSLLGRLSRTQVRELFQQSHCVVSSSHIETFGVTLIEALACGRPVIATRSGGPQDFVEAEDGLLVLLNDAQALAAALRYMVNHHADYDPTLIRQRCEQRFSEQAVVGQLLAYYEKAIARSRSEL